MQLSTMAMYAYTVGRAVTTTGSSGAMGLAPPWAMGHQSVSGF